MYKHKSLLFDSWFKNLNFPIKMVCFVIILDS